MAEQDDAPESQGSKPYQQYDSELARGQLQKCSNEDVPTGIRKDLWGLFTLTQKLAYIDRRDIQWFRSNARIIKLRWIIANNRRMYTPKQALDFAQAMNVYEADITRGIEGREREAQVREWAGQPPQPAQSAKQPGFFTRVFGFGKEAQRE